MRSNPPPIPAGGVAGISRSSQEQATEHSQKCNQPVRAQSTETAFGWSVTLRRWPRLVIQLHIPIPLRKLNSSMLAGGFLSLSRSAVNRDLDSQTAGRRTNNPLNTTFSALHQAAVRVLRAPTNQARRATPGK